MPSVSLAVDNIASWPAPLTGKPHILYRDIECKGLLILRVAPTGSRSWLIECKNGAGVDKQRAFGTYPALGLADARRTVYKLESEIALEGLEAVKDDAPVTLRKSYEDWKSTTHPKDSTAHTYESVLQTNAKDWWERPLRSIGRQEVIDRCKHIYEVRGATRQGDQFFQVIRALANHSQILPNPAANFKQKGKSEDKEPARPMAPEVLPALLDAIGQLSQEASTFYTASLFTGFRSLGVMAMQWQYLKLGPRASYTIPARAVGFKNGGAWAFPICDYLAEVLRQYKRYHDRTKSGSVYVFPGEGQNADSYQKRIDGSLKSLRAASGLPLLRNNDFRDTWASYLTALYQKNFITERLLDHRFSGKNISAQEVGMLYASAIPQSIDMSAQMQMAAVDEGEALRPLVEGYASAMLYLAGRIKRGPTMTAKEVRFYDGVDRTFIHRNPEMSVEKWLRLAAAHPELAFASQTPVLS